MPLTRRHNCYVRSCSAEPPAVAAGDFGVGVAFGAGLVLRSAAAKVKTNISFVASRFLKKFFPHGRHGDTGAKRGHP
jgi:hypothetical protein